MARERLGGDNQTLSPSIALLYLLPARMVWYDKPASSVMDR
jgi:hypothetical protein